MKMNSQNRIFARQVQVDLLALDDADLFQVLHQWVDGTGSSEAADEIVEEARLALGYVKVQTNTEPLAYPQNELLAPKVQWQAPSPTQLRTLLTAMDVKAFAQYVIPLAFQSLHTTYPEWYEGLTFNAHLANHLRWIGTNRGTMSKEPRVRQ